MISIIVPAFKEEKTIVAAMQRLDRVVYSYSREYEIIVVVDGYVDKTWENATNANLPNLRIVGYEKNQGKGFALQFGMQFVTGDITSFFDADLDIDPECLVGMWKALESQEISGVIGSKTHPNSVVKYPISRRWMSNTMRWLVRNLFGLDIGDTQTGAKTFRTAALRPVVLATRRRDFSFDVELLARLSMSGHKVIEAPIVLDYSFTSTVRPSSVAKVLAGLIALKFALWRERRS